MLAIQYRNKFYENIIITYSAYSLSLRFVLRNIFMEPEILIRSQAHATVTYHLSRSSLVKLKLISRVRTFIPHFCKIKADSLASTTNSS